jgi:CheY-like chemotaxis protein
MTSTPVPAPGVDRNPLTLLVDRDRETRELYAEFLTRSGGWDIEEAEDGREALAKAIARRPDVIVAETRLPGLSGLDLCALLRRDASTSNIPFIFVTADAYAPDIRRAERAGADVVLTKPCLPDRLLTEMQRVLIRAHDGARGGAGAQGETSSPAREPVVRASVVVPQPPPSSGSTSKRAMLSRVHRRGDTTEPPTTPPALICPKCDQVLRYLRSHVGGVSARHPEQWDYFECPAGCGTFQYRERTKKIRKV